LDPAPVGRLVGAARGTGGPSVAGCPGAGKEPARDAFRPKVAVQRSPGDRL